MNKTVKNILCGFMVLLLVAIIVWVIVAGNNREENPDDEKPTLEYNESEVLEAAAQLLKKSELANEIFFYSGIPYIVEEQSDARYQKADSAYLASIGIMTCTDLKNFTRGIFSHEQYATLERMFLTGASSDGFNTPAHYIGEFVEGEDGKYEEVGILVYIGRTDNKYIVKKDEKTVFDISTLTLVGDDGERVFLAVDCEVTKSGEENRAVKGREIVLIKEDGEWRLDAQTKTAYPAIN